MESPTSPSSFGDSVVHGFDEYLTYLKMSFENPDVHNPLIYLFVVYAVAFTLENIFPKQLNYTVVGRKGFWTDILYLVFIDFAIQVIGLYAVCSGIEFLMRKLFSSAGMELPLINLHEALPPTLRFIVFFLLIDFLQWFAHFVMHRSNFLWQFHKIHHAQEQLGFGSTRHFHFGEYLILKPAFWIPFALCGFQAELYVVWYVWIAYMLTFLSHCNIKINWGPIKYIFITPETHYWHHSKNIPGRFGNNYASSLVIWDLIFGYFYNPKDKKPILGIPDNDVPPTFLGQMAYPFKSLFRMKSSPPQNKDKDYVPAQTRQEKRKATK